MTLELSMMDEVLKSKSHLVCLPCTGFFLAKLALSLSMAGWLHRATFVVYICIWVNPSKRVPG